MKTRGKPFSETEVRNWCFQIFQALNHMHQRGYFHRDLKPGIVILHWILHFNVTTVELCALFVAKTKLSHMSSDTVVM